MQHDSISQPAAKKERLFLPRQAFLRKRFQFEQVKAEGVTAHGKLMLVTILNQDSAELPKFGIITSRRVGPAVVRNRVRRRIREMVRLNQKLLRKGIWLVVVAKRAAAQASYAELEKEWKRLVQKLLR